MAKKSKISIMDPEIVKQARDKLWRAGNLEWKLSATQKKINSFFRSNPQKITTLCSSRRGGKSFLLAILAIEECIRKPKAIIKFIQPAQNMIRKNIRPIMIEILKDCPKEIKPVFRGQDNIYLFPNGSEIHLAGTDNGNADSLRGSNADLCLVDEAGFCSDLPYVINSVLTPLTLLTKGKIILSSTVPPDPNHEFIDYMKSCEEKGSLILKTIYDFRDDDLKSPNARITDELINEIVAAYPKGIESDAFRNEYLCQVIYNSNESVIPEFTEEVQKTCVKEWKRPAFFHCYEGMDVGFKDFTGVLFGYYDFLSAVLVIEDELVLSRMTTDSLATGIKTKERALWYVPATGEVISPKMRVSDNNLILINDLMRMHNLLFFPTQKDNKEAAINALRVAIANEEIIIHPRCTTLISHLRNTTWNKAKTDFRRSQDGAHGDLLMALVYLYRNLDKMSNPYPPNYRLTPNYQRLNADAYYMKDDLARSMETSAGVQGFKKIFIPKKRK